MEMIWCYSKLIILIYFSFLLRTSTAQGAATTIFDSNSCPCDCTISLQEECPLGRYTSRGDCSCCKVCARHAGQLCDPLLFPCDRQFGLVCNETSGVCEGK